LRVNVLFVYLDQVRCMLLSVACRGGCAITLDENLLHGRSEHSETFDNEPLVASHNGFFVVAVMEVFAFH